MGAARDIQIAPSILSADFGRLADQIAAVTPAADLLHLDIMDGHFVPNLSIGVPVVESVRDYTDLPLDVHLMITDPGKYAPAFVDAGADGITFHIEVAPDPQPLIQQLRDLDVEVGIALNPGTPAEAVLPFIDLVDLVLVMTVWPGFGGQAFMAECLPKIETLAQQMTTSQALQVDGGIGPDTAPRVTRAGANVLVAGSAIFAQADPAAAARHLRAAALSGRTEAEQTA
jgi:ribulose-phosphate 3-epimerase